MKTIRHFATLLLLFATAVFTLSSCADDDADQAYNLNGYWQGTIDGSYYSNRYHTSDTWDTEIWFVQDGVFSNGGTGVERDYNRYGLVNECSFDWTVVNGRIHMEFSDGYRIIIRDYELYSIGNSMRFKGYFDEYYSGRQLATFNLIKIDSWRSYAKMHEMQPLEQDSTETTVTEKGGKQ